MLDDILSFSSDLVLLIALYLDPKDARSVGSVAKSYRALVSSDYLWSQLVRTRIVGFKSLSIDGIATIRDATLLSTYWEMFFLFRRLDFPLLGYYRTHAGAGGLCSIKLVDGALVCRRIANNDNYEDDSLSFKVILEGSNGNHGSSSVPTGTQAKLFVNSSFLELSFYDGEEVGMSPLPSLCNLYDDCWDASQVIKQLTAPDDLDLPRQLAGLLGLTTANYGPHGTEVLHLSIQVPTGPEMGRYGEPEDLISDIRLRGLKVTGDRNVPKGQVSFSLSLSLSVNMEEEMASDSRSLIYIRGDGTMHQERISTTVSRSVAWYKGKGQINRIPGTWDPEWVTCSFLLYQAPRSENGAVGVLVWKDLEHMYVHAMEISPMSRSNAELCAGFSYC